MKQTRALLGSLLVSCALLPPAVSASIAPSDYARTFSITFGGYAGVTPIVDFPALVRLSPANISGFTYADFLTFDGDNVPTGADLCFADEDGNELAFEIDTWNPSGESLVWVRIPELTSTTTIHAYYGQENATLPTSSTDGTVWNACIGVWHMNADLADSTAHALDATASGFASTDGILGGAYATSATSNQGISAPNYSSAGPASASVFTVSGWFLPDVPLSNGRRLFSRKSAYTTKSGFEAFLNNGTDSSSLVVRGANTGNGFTFTGPSFSADTWMHYVIQFNDTEVTAYLNGVPFTQVSSSGMSAPTDNSQALGIGSYNNRSGAGTFAGAIDEVRLMDGLTTADRVAADYATVADPTFASYSASTSTGAATLPRVTSAVASDIAAFTATANGRLVAAGVAPCVVKILWGEDPDNLAMTQTVATVSAAQDLSFSLATQPSTTYHYRFLAVDAAANESLSALMSFTTLSGHAAFGDPALADAGTPAGEGVPHVAAASATVELTDPGTGVATVELLFGTDPEALSIEETWTGITAAQTFTHTVSNLVDATKYYAQFRVTVLDHGETFVTETAVASIMLAGDVVWTGGTSGSWLVASNWSPAVVPDAASISARIDADPAVDSAVTLSVAENIAAGAVVVDAGDSLTVTKSANSKTATFAGLDNAGTVSVRGQANGNAQTMSLKILGEGTFRNAAGAAVNVVGSTGRNRTATRLEIGLDAVNDGTIAVTQPSADRNNAMVTLRNQGVFTNNGEVTIELTGTYSSSDTYARLYLAESESNAITVFEGTGRLTLAGDRDAALSGGVSINAATRTHTITNGPGHTIEGAGSVSDIAIHNEGLLRATGELRPLNLAQAYRNSIYGKPTVNAAGGRIVAAGAGGLYIGYNGNHASCFKNEGLLEARTGSFIEIRSYCTAQESTSDTPASTLALGGTLAGGGRFVAHRPVVLTDAARLAPGDLANADGTGASRGGTLTVTTNLVLSADTVLDFQFGRPEAGGYDAVVVDGSLTLDGVMTPSALSGSGAGGLYRIFTCTPGELVDNGLEIAATEGMPRPQLFVDADAGTVDILWPGQASVVLIR